MKNKRKGAASGEANAVLMILAVVLVLVFLLGPFEWIISLFLGTCFMQVIMVIVLIVAAICVFSGKG